MHFIDLCALKIKVSKSKSSQKSHIDVSWPSEIVSKLIYGVPVPLVSQQATQVVDGRNEIKEGLLPCPPPLYLHVPGFYDNHCRLHIHFILIAFFEVTDIDVDNVSCLCILMRILTVYVIRASYYTPGWIISHKI